MAILKFLLGLATMKTIPRSGWVSHGVSLSDTESVADHSFSTCALSLVIADLEAERGVHVNVERVLRMALLHDVSESLTFDISRTYLEYLGTKGEKIKNQLEEAAWKHVVRGLNDKGLARSYSRIQSEYVDGRTRESKIVHAADALDILLQVIEYRRRGCPESSLADLWNETNGRLSRSDVPSARKIHSVLAKEGKRREGKISIK